MEAVLSRAANVLVDGHVHYYSCFNPTLFLQSAVANFARYGCPGAQRVLCLTESAPDYWFESLVERLDSELAADWWIRPTAEQNSLQLVCNEIAHASQLLVVAGHQVVSSDDLEVLTIGVREKLPDGSTTHDLVAQTLSHGGLPVLPWGFGKWLGNRGRIVEQLVTDFGESVLLGDNGGRLRFGAQPKLLEQIRSRGQHLFSGSDPLPMPGQEKRVGSFGTRLAAQIDPERPFQSLHQQLAGDRDQGADDTHLQAQGYGELEEPFAFVRNQFVMQWRKRISHD